MKILDLEYFSLYGIVVLVLVVGNSWFVWAIDSSVKFQP